MGSRAALRIEGSRVWNYPQQTTVIRFCHDLVGSAAGISIKLAANPSNSTERTRVAHDAHLEELP